MPELPEVETIRRGLDAQLVGRTVGRLVIGHPKVFQTETGLLARRLRGQKVVGLDRRGKFLILALERRCLIFHLGMTGQLTFRDPRRRDSKRFARHPVTGLQRAVQHAPDQHTHLQVEFEEGGSILFRDIRKFGKVFLIDKKPSTLREFFSRLGLEPLSSDYQLRAFLEGCRGRKVTIKSLLLDQHFVAGVGNIYADEALHESGIHPARRVHRLRRWEKERLFEAIPLVLRLGVEAGGTSFRDYVDSRGEKGNHQENLRVYGREGEACARCGSAIVKIVLGQRGTHFCPCCQPRQGQARGQ